MKILQLVTSRQYRGAEIFAANLSKELQSLGHEIIFVGLYQNHQNILELQGATNLDLAKGKRGFSITLIKDLVKLIRKERPDVIQCNGSDTLKYMVAASYFTPRIPITYRNISMISAWLNGPKSLLYKKMFSRVHHVTSVGSEASQDFRKALNFPQEKISVIRRGIPVKDDKNFSPASLKKEFHLDTDDKIAVHIGNFSEEKNHEFLLHVFQYIKEKNRGFKLILVGKGDLFEVIKKRILELKLQDTVFLTGFRKDIPEVLAASQCFVLSSKVEGVPGVILEAAAQKVPAVATNVGGVKEVLINNKTGFIVDDFNKKQFAEKIIEILSHDSLRKKLGENAYKMVVEEFNPVENAKKFEELYIELLNRK